MSPDDPRHGTNAGYIAHAFARDTACEPCRTAAADYRRGLRARRYLARTNRLYVDATGTIRRIHALQALGWRLKDIDRAIGRDPATNYVHNLTRQAKVHLDTAKKVAAAYDRLSMKLGPSQRSRDVAERNRWAVPLAWDEGDIDDPNARPHGRQGRRIPKTVDPIVVARILAGDGTMKATKAERHEVIRRWPDSIYALEQLRPDWNLSRDLREMRAELEEAS